MLVDIKKLLFSPGESIAQMIIEEIDKAEKEINVMVFWFTWKPIGDALIRAHRRGLDINIILDSRSAEMKIRDVDPINETVMPEYLIENGIRNEEIRIYDGELLHHKIILIDNKSVLMGSCNFFNASINRHEEHYMLAESDELYNVFFKKFKHLWYHKTSTYKKQCSFKRTRR